MAAAEESKDTFDLKHACVILCPNESNGRMMSETCILPACTQVRLSWYLVISVIRFIPQFHYFETPQCVFYHGSSSASLQEYRGTDIVFARYHDCNGKQSKHKCFIYATYSQKSTGQDTVSDISELTV